MAVTTVSNVNDAAPIANEQEAKPVSAHEQEAQVQATEASGSNEPSESAPEADKVASTEVESDDLHAEDESGSDDHAEDGKNGKRRSDLEKRFNRFTRKLTAQEQEINALREKLAEKEQTVAKAPVRSDEEPKLDDFETYTEWQAAHNQYLVQREFQVREEQQRTHQMQVGFQKRFQESGIDLDEYKEALEEMASYNVPQPDQEVVEFMLESEVGPHISFYYATHPEEAKRVASLPKSRQLVEFARTETRILAERSEKSKTSEPKPVKKQTAAPKPVEPVTAGAVPVTNKSAADVANDYGAWKAKREQELNGRRR